MAQVMKLESEEENFWKSLWYCVLKKYGREGKIILKKKEFCRVDTGIQAMQFTNGNVHINISRLAVKK